MDVFETVAAQIIVWFWCFVDLFLFARRKFANNSILVLEPGKQIGDFLSSYYMICLL